MKITLKHPIDTGDGRAIVEIEIGKFKVKHLKMIPSELYSIAKDKEDLEQIKKGSSRYKKLENEIAKKTTESITALLPLLASLTGLTEQILDEMEIPDFLPLLDKLLPILGEVLDQTA